jgi:hypothetical protein
MGGAGVGTASPNGGCCASAPAGAYLGGRWRCSNFPIPLRSILHWRHCGFTSSRCHHPMKLQEHCVFSKSTIDFVDASTRGIYD